MTTIRTGVAALLFASIAAGCASDPPIIQRVDLQLPEFDAGLHRAYADRGAERLEGQGFMRQSGGGVVTCAGEQVLLVPATPYFESIVAQMSAGSVMPAGAKAAQGAADVVRRTQCDAQGRFAFEALPAGEWVVMTNVQWTVAGRPQGGVLRRYVTLRGDTVSTLLTDANFAGR